MKYTKKNASISTYSTSASSMAKALTVLTLLMASSATAVDLATFKVAERVKTQLRSIENYPNRTHLCLGFLGVHPQDGTEKRANQDSQRQNKGCDECELWRNEVQRGAAANDLRH